MIGLTARLRRREHRPPGPFPDILPERPRRRRGPAAAATGALVLAATAAWLAAPFRGTAGSQAPPALGIHKVQGAAWRPDLGHPLFVAVLGSDVRSGAPGSGGRCDAVHIVAINPQAKAGTIINLPRDSYVDVAGRGRDKINAACVNGPDRMIQTLQNLTGMQIHYYVMTEFSHFMRFIDELGGIEVNVPYGMNDAASGARFQPGPQHMQGGHVLAFSRNRKDTPNGDFSRTENQGQVILASLSKFRNETASDWHRILHYIRVARRHTQISVPIGEAARLALLAREIDPAAVQNITLPGSTGSAGGASVVFIAPGDIFDRVRDDGIY